jgi:hypothetical protein
VARAFAEHQLLTASDTAAAAAASSSQAQSGGGGGGGGLLECGCCFGDYPFEGTWFGLWFVVVGWFCACGVFVFCVLGGGGVLCNLCFVGRFGIA